MKTSNKDIISIVNANYFIKDRIRLLIENGYNVIRKSMGSGGVLQEKKDQKRYVYTNKSWNR